MDLQFVDRADDTPSLTNFNISTAITLDPSVDELLFQQIEIKDYIVNENNALKTECVVRIFGLTETGESVCCNIRGFHAYFYVQLPEITNCEEFRNELNKEYKRSGEEPVVAVEIVYRFSIHGYHGREKIKFLKITVAIPSDINLVKKHFRREICFETDIDFILRFMVNTEIDGCTWIKLPPKTWKFIGNQQDSENDSHCKIEVEMDFSQHKFISYKSDDVWSKIAPLKMLSLNIQCIPSDLNKFPDAEHDPVVLITNTLFIHGESTPYMKKIFVLNGCLPINGVEFETFNNERDMLEAWSYFVRFSDPDIITGYNIENFDIPYIINRAHFLKTTNSTFLGRLRNIATSVKSGFFESKQMGRHLNMQINIDGRVIFDLHNIIQREHQLRSYSFSAVCYNFLGKSKEDFDWDIKSKLYNCDQSTRQRLARYSMKNTVSIIELLNHLMSVVNYVEMARVTGVTLQALLRRGQLIRVYSQLLRKSKERDFVLQTNHHPESHEKYEGGCVLEARCGYYVEPITLLDFASMYPNIMITFNLCHSTLLHPSLEKRLKLSSEDINISPTNCKFVKPHIRKGLLPEILEYLLAARKAVKQKLKIEQDASKRAILDGRQLAIKLTANAVYGFTGAQHGGKLPCLEVAKSTTAYGRQIINQTKNEIESHYSRANGYANDAQVIYGDTDSVMINFGIKDIKSNIAQGHNAAAYISSLFPGPVTLEFENIFCPYFLLGKKRYAGLKYTKSEIHDGIVTRGIETVRRDSPLIVKKLLNNCLKEIFVEKDIDGAVKCAHHVISNLYCNKVDIHDLVITRTVRDERQFMKKILEGMPHLNYAVGERVSYVICATGIKAPFYEKLKDPIDVIEKQIPIDYDYYVQRCITKPLLQFFQPILGDQAENRIFSGHHTLTRKAYTSELSGSKGTILTYITKRFTCLSCNTLIPNTMEDTAVCVRCQSKRIDVYSREMNAMRSLEEKLWRSRVECQTCQESLMQEILCTNRDCPILYTKRKAEKDLKAQKICLNRFGLSNW